MLIQPRPRLILLYIYWDCTVVRTVPFYVLFKGHKNEAHRLQVVLWLECEHKEVIVCCKESLLGCAVTIGMSWRGFRSSSSLHIYNSSLCQFRWAERRWLLAVAICISI
jgi:hypothetical protein